MSCESASHHFALFFFETGSLVGFVVLKLPQYFLQRARKLAQIVDLKLPQYFLQHARKLAHAQMIDSDSQLQLISPDLSTTMPRVHRALTGCRRLTLVPCRRPPPFSSRRVVPCPRLSRLRRQSEGTAAFYCRCAGGGGRSHPSLLSSVATTTLRVAHPPPSSRSVQHLLS